MFPGANAQVYYNDAGEPIGWDYPSDEPTDDELYWMEAPEHEEEMSEPDPEDMSLEELWEEYNTLHEDLMEYVDGDAENGPREGVQPPDRMTALWEEINRR